ncbi:flavohemoprotein [Streptomyces sp. NPDC001817]|uniref:flavohemoprotein n=1 Tax=Streptomyces sp. NPDC001817 TaxID=3154398 RepID=UPI003317D48B
MEVVAPHVSEPAAYFYDILFARHPQVRDLFPAELDVQRERPDRALLRIVELVDDPGNLIAYCSHYAGPAWSPEPAAAWQRAYTAAADVMVRAAKEDARHRPAVWQANIVEHVHRGYGIAEITVRPQLPYPFVAGQYVSIATPWAPRLRRYYSPAHVRAVPGGTVSSALVHHARPGDPVRLGTGLAPIRALIEQAARDGIGDAREVSLFIGARTADEPHGLDDMLRMSQRYHWLRVRAAVSQERIVGLEGTPPQVLAELGPWYRHEAYRCGPPQMLGEAVQALTRHGGPPHHIHYDPWDVPVLTAPLGPPPPEEETDQL